MTASSSGWQRKPHARSDQDASNPEFILELTDRLPAWQLKNRQKVRQTIASGVEAQKKVGEG